MLTELHETHARIDLPAGPRDHEGPHVAQAIAREAKWRQIVCSGQAALDDVTISRWDDPREASWHAATTPSDRYFVGIALKTTRAILTRERRIIFDGTMPSGTLYVSAPSRQLSAQFQAPCAFLHVHISAEHFPTRWAQGAAEGLDDLVLLRDPLAAGLAKALAEQGDAAGHRFAHCIGQILAMHLARPELPRAKVNALPNGACGASSNISPLISNAASACRSSPMLRVSRGCISPHSSVQRPDTVLANTCSIIESSMQSRC